MLAGLDNPELEHAIQVMGGDTQRFARLLSSFAERHRGDADTMERLLAASKFQKARQIAHLLKGAAATLGLARLRLAAAQIEDALRENRVDRGLLDPLLANFRREMTLIHETMSGMREKEHFDYSPTAFAAESARNLLLRMEKLLEADDTAVNDLFSEYQPVLEQLFGKLAVDLAMQIDNFDYHAALKAVREMLNRCRPDESLM